MVVPAVGITPVPLKNKSEFKDYAQDNDAWRGYEYDNKRGTLLDAVSSEDYYEDGKYIPDSMVGVCRNVKKKIGEAGKFMLLSDSEIEKFIIDGLRN